MKNLLLNDDIYFTRSQMAKISGISKYTIKFWTNCGLLDYKTDPSNGYKHYSLFKLPELVEANTFSKIGIPIADQKLLRSCDRQSKLKIYKQNTVFIEDRLQKLKDGLSKLSSMIEMMEYLDAKEDIGFYDKEPDFDILVRVDQKSTKLMRALFDGNASNNTLVRFDKTGTVTLSQPATGLKINDKNLPAIWEKSNDKGFLARIVKKVGDNMPNVTKEELYFEASKCGFEVECIIYKYLTSVEEKGSTVNYFEAYIQYKK